jgi:AcrR family transcriptional regulator
VTPGGSEIGLDRAAPRERIDAAVVDLLAERGYERISIELILERADVDRAEFDHRFADLQDCVMQVYREHLDRFVELVLAAYSAEDTWRDGIRAAGYAIARFLRDNPRMARAGVIELLAAGPPAEAQRASSLDRLVEMIDAGRQELDEPDSITRGVAEGVLGSVYEIVIRDLQAGRGTAAAEDAVPQLLYFALRPYLGHEVAREELTMRPPPEPDEEGG